MKPNLKPYLEPGRLEAGCDEAGRGPLAGPVYAAAVILPPDFFHPLLNDSKQMTEKAREELRPIIEKEAIAWAVEAVSAQEIDQLNILWASVTGMQRAVQRLNPKPEFLLIDGNKFRPFQGYGFKDFQTVVHGDATYASIAAVPSVWLGPQYGLPHGRAYRSNPAPRLYAMAPEKFSR